MTRMTNCVFCGCWIVTETGSYTYEVESGDIHNCKKEFYYYTDTGSLEKAISCDYHGWVTGKHRCRGIRN